MSNSLDLYSGRPDRVSLGDIAEVAGVSKATVCRALRGRGRVSSATRKRLQALAKKMGYTPDPALSALTRYRWGSRAGERTRYAIALVSVDALDTGKVTNSSKVRAMGVEARAKELNLIFERHALDSRTSPSALSNMLFARGIDGIIFQISGPVFSWNFPWEKFACVTIGFDGEAHRLNSVTSDWFSAVRTASAKARLTKGRRIGFANFYRGNPSMDFRIQAASLLEREASRKELGPQPQILWYPKDQNLEQDIFKSCRDPFLRWFEKEKPDVIIDGNRLAQWWLRDAGVKIPSQVTLATLNANPQKEPDIAGAVHQRDRHGRLAVDLVYNLIQINERGMSDAPLRLTSICAWHDAKSLPQFR